MLVAYRYYVSWSNDRPLDERMPSRFQFRELRRTTSSHEYPHANM